MNKVKEYNPKNDIKIHNGFWVDTANLMREYEKDGNEQGYEAIVDCRILYLRYTKLENNL